jgi:hypothetical protein
MGGDTVELAAGTTVTIAPGKTFTLKAGAKIIGDGKLIAGNTEIMGGWEVQSTATPPEDDFVTIKYESSGTTTITASATSASLVAMGPGATITQRGGATNDLKLANDTIINLSTDGILTLTAAPYNTAGDAVTAKAKVSFGNTGSSIKIGGVESQGTLDNTTLQSVLGHGTNAIAVTSLTGATPAASGILSTLSQIIGVADGSGVLQGPQQDKDGDGNLLSLPGNLIIKAGIPATAN